MDSMCSQGVSETILNMVGEQLKLKGDMDAEEVLDVAFQANNHGPSVNEQVDDRLDRHIRHGADLESIDRVCNDQIHKGASDRHIRVSQDNDKNVGSSSNIGENAKSSGCLDKIVNSQSREDGDMKGALGSHISVHIVEHSKNYGGSNQNVIDRGEGDKVEDNESNLLLIEGDNAKNTVIPGRDPFEDYDNLGFNIFLLKRWLTREKCLTGNKLSISLTQKEVKQAQAIIARSTGKPIRYNHGKILKMNLHFQNSVREKMLAVIKSEYTQMKGRLAEEIKLVYDAILEEISGVDEMD